MPTLLDATVTVRVPRDAHGDLQEGVETRLRRISAVDRVDSFEVTGVRPGLNDLRVRVSMTVVLADEAVSEQPPAAVLADETGIEDIGVEE